ncbi:MAG: Response regulator receiver domain [Pseudomonadota bacterium]|jgi:CheY-like chemotaxis protein
MSTPEKVELIMTDIVMQGRGGPEFAQYWRDKHPEAKFLVTSTIPQEGRQGPRVSSRNLLWKPFTARALLDRVEEILGRS